MILWIQNNASIDPNHPHSHLDLSVAVGCDELGHVAEKLCRLHDAVVQDGGRVSVLSGAALAVGPLDVESVGALAGDRLADLVNMG